MKMVQLEKILRKGVLETERRHIRAKLAQRKNYLRLDLNENLLELDARQFGDMVSAISPDSVSAYPDLAAIYSKMAAHVGLNEDEIVLTNGSDMGIKSIFDICIEKGDHIILHDPYFLMYERYAQFFEATIDAVPVTDVDWRPDVGAMLERVTARTKMMVVEAPSGNIGTGPAFDDLDRMAAVLERKNVLLIIDEAYLYVENNTSANLSLVRKYGNVIVVRTMSKAYGLAGARLGVLMTSAELAKMLYKVRSLYEISGITARLAEWHLDHPEVLEAYQDAVKASKRYLAAELAASALRFRMTDANFVIVELTPQRSTIEFAAALKERGILIGKTYTLPKLRGWARIGIGTLADSERLIAAIKSVIAERNASPFFGRTAASA
jgi:histidinol-phosphate aminotransferase